MIIFNYLSPFLPHKTRPRRESSKENVVAGFPHQPGHQPESRTAREPDTLSGLIGLLVATLGPPHPAYTFRDDIQRVPDAC